MKKYLFSLSLACLFSLCSKAQEKLIYSSPSLKCNDTVWVFTPQNVVANPPTLILLHGWSGCYNDWNRLAPLQDIANEFKFRIICPDGFYNSWYLNDSDSSKMQWRDFFNKEFMPDITRKYNLCPNETFITGLSMGGHGAINLFIDNPELFRSAGSMSGVLDLGDTTLKEDWVYKVTGNDSLRVDRESALNRIESVKEMIKSPLIITCGYHDFYVKCSDKFSKFCREKDIPHVLILSPGKHSWRYWNYALRLHLSHFRKIVDGDNLGF